jgi:hypothetical protein
LTALLKIVIFSIIWAEICNEAAINFNVLSWNSPGGNE